MTSAVVYCSLGSIMTYLLYTGFLRISPSTHISVALIYCHVTGDPKYAPSPNSPQIFTCVPVDMVSTLEIPYPDRTFPHNTALLTLIDNAAFLLKHGCQLVLLMAESHPAFKSLMPLACFLTSATYCNSHM